MFNVKPNFKLEKTKLASGFSFVVGCDEVGRGSLAGPVVAAAVVLDPKQTYKLKEVRDSKQISAEKRFSLERVIKQYSLGFGIGVVSHEVIDQINIHKATLLAMKQAVESLEAKLKVSMKQTFIYIDGKFIIPELSYEQQAVVGGDNKILSVAAASILAKTFRDRLMVKLHDKHPAYNFAQHKGYGTLQHRTAVKRFGVSAVHRLSFCSNI